MTIYKNFYQLMGKSVKVIFQNYKTLQIKSTIPAHLKPKRWSYEVKIY